MAKKAFKQNWSLLEAGVSATVRQDSPITKVFPLLSKSIVLVWCLFCGRPCLATDLASELGRLTGYVVLGDETIDDFEGCDYGKIIQFRSGAHVTCSGYGYQYSYGADAVIMVRPVDKENFHCKMIVEDDIYEVSCGGYMREKIKSLRWFRDQSTDAEARNFVEYWLRILGVQE